MLLEGAAWKSMFGAEVLPGRLICPVQAYLQFCLSRELGVQLLIKQTYMASSPIPLFLSALVLQVLCAQTYTFLLHLQVSSARSLPFSASAPILNEEGETMMLPIGSH